MLTDFLLMPVGQFIAWFVSVALVGAVGFALNLVDWPEWAENVIKTVAIATLTTFVTSLAAFIPDQFLQMKLLDAILFLLAGLAGSFGALKFGHLKALEVRAKAAYYAEQLGEPEWQ